MRFAKIGDRVFYTYAEYDLDEGKKSLVGETRPATVVRDFSQGHPSQTDPTIPCYNLSVDTDFGNDGPRHSSGKYWATSRQLSDTPAPGKFHFAE